MRWLWMGMGESHPSDRVPRWTIWRITISMSTMTMSTRKVRVGVWLLSLFYAFRFSRDRSIHEYQGVDVLPR